MHVNGRMRCISYGLAIAFVVATMCSGAWGQGEIAATSQTLHGRVVNAISGVGIARALVTANARSLLTDSQGRFEFAQFMDTSANVTAQRPGFSAGTGLAAHGGPTRVTDLQSSIIVRLYPDAVVTGAVTGTDGLGLGQVEVLLRQLNPGQGPHWLIAGTAMTNDRGEYRLQAPAGTFRLSVVYQARMRSSGATLSPTSFPEAAVNSAQEGFRLGPGEERHVDLRARTGQSFPVTLTVDQIEGLDARRGGVRFQVSQADGESFSPSAQATGAPGEYRMSLPSGNYTLHAHLEARDESMDGVAKISVAGHALNGLVMRLAPLTAIGVEVRAATSAGPSTFGDPSTTPDARQMNLRLTRISDGVNDGFGSDSSLHQRQDKSYEFRVPAGRYRLEAFAQGNWFATSATLGGTDLMTSDMIVGPGAAGGLIRLLASNQHGTLRGRVLHAAARENLWVYLVPVEPMLSALPPLGVAADGTFVGWEPAGAYTLVAVDGQVPQDLRNPEAQARLSSGGAEVKIVKDTGVSVDLELRSLEGAKP